MESVNPITCDVTLPVLSRTQKYKFNHNCSAEELCGLQKILDVKDVLNFSFKGQLIQHKKKNYELHASLKATIIQNCVISWSPVKTLINEKIRRHYTEGWGKNNSQELSLNINSDDIEPIYNKLDIGAMALEALCLVIPDYPRKKNVLFEGVTITNNGLKPIDKTVGNPFLILKDFLQNKNT